LRCAGGIWAARQLVADLQSVLLDQRSRAIRDKAARNAFIVMAHAVGALLIAYGRFLGAAVPAIALSAVTALAAVTCTVCDCCLRRSP